VDLNTVKDPHAIAFAVSTELGMDYNQILMDVIQNPPEGLSYIVIADFVEAQQALNLQELKKALQESCRRYLRRFDWAPIQITSSAQLS
jgi:hypothetical protein